VTSDQAILFGILGGVFVLLIWGRWRYDVVAFSALVACVIAGVVPADKAFSGFGHPATVVIALVLIVSRGLSASGVIELVASWVIKSSRALFAHIGIMAMLAAVLSAVMNNVAALALLMPVDLQAARSAKRSAALSLMPLSFASILGGMVTLIGTPPNIVVAAYRGDSLGEPFRMFDFTPVGLSLAIIGVIFVALIGWRLIPKSAGLKGSNDTLLHVEDYVAELQVSEGGTAIGMTWTQVRAVVEEADGQLLGLVRKGARIPVYGDYTKLETDDLIIVQAGPSELDMIGGKLGLRYPEEWQAEDVLHGGQLQLAEVVLPEGALATGRTAVGLNVGPLSSVRLLGLSRQGRGVRERVRHVRFEAGDILLLLGSKTALPEAITQLGALQLARRGLQVIRREKAGLAVALFAAAILAASTGWVYLPVALAALVVAYLAFGVVPPSEVYTSIEWPVIILLGAMIPIGAALEQSGGTSVIANGIVSLSEGYAPWAVLTILMVVTMTLSDVMNNTATAVIAAPIAVEIATKLNVNPDPFLMAVAVAASCAFLTPIGHKNNLLILGPGGYRFGDYWRMGLPLELLIVAAGVPLLLLFWPM
jgi:di/tricarboxylate transporter